MKIGRQIVENENRYEQLYIKAKKNSKIYYFLAVLPECLVIWGYFAINFIEVLNFTSDLIKYDFLNNSWSFLGVELGFFIRCAIISTFINFMWHKNMPEEYRKISKGEKPPSVLRPWLAVMQTILCGLLILSAISSIAPCIIYVVDYGGYVYTISLICCIFGAVGYSGLLYYLIKYFRYFRWTWEELQLPADIRYEQYRENRLKEQQRKEAKRREARQKKAEAVKAKWQAFREAHSSGNKTEKPAAKTIQTQADRRAELENLKKLYEDGLIDEEEYRRAREKTLDI